MRLYDKNALARLLDMTPKNVQKLTEKGVLKERQRGLYAPEEATRCYIHFLRDRNQDAEGLDYNEERARLIKAKRINEELELATKQGDLHRSEDVERVITAALINFKSRLSAIPAEEADKLAGMTDRAGIFKHLNGKIKEALAELADFKELLKEVEKLEDEENDD